MGSTTWGEFEVQQDPPVRLTISAVSASFFDTLGASASLGRTFAPEEDGAEAERVMVLSHAAWRQHFDMDSDIVGSAVPVGARREPFTVVGVMPPAFQFPPGADVWTPVGRELAGIFRENGMDAGTQRGLGVLYVIGRLAPGRTLDEARAEMDVIVPGLWEAHSSRGGTRGAVVTRLTDYLFGNADAALFVLLGGGALLLLIAVANVTGLMIVRAQSRGRDTAVQCALGIGRGRPVPRPTGGDPARHGRRGGGRHRPRVGLRGPAASLSSRGCATALAVRPRPAREAARATRSSSRRSRWRSS